MESYKEKDYEKNILIVDTNEELLRILSRELRNKYNVTIAGSASEALEELKHKKFTAAILAYNLPRVSSLELAEDLKHYGGNMCIILMNGYTPTLGLEKSVDAVVKKPDIISTPTLRRELVPDLEKLLQCAAECQN